MSPARLSRPSAVRTILAASATVPPLGADARLKQGQQGQAREQQAVRREHRVGGRPGDANDERDRENNGGNYGKHPRFLPVQGVTGSASAPRRRSSGSCRSSSAGRPG